MQPGQPVGKVLAAALLAATGSEETAGRPAVASTPQPAAAEVFARFMADAEGVLSVALAEMHAARPPDPVSFLVEALGRS